MKLSLACSVICKYNEFNYQETTAEGGSTDVKTLRKYIWIFPLISGVCWGGAGIFVRTLLQDGLDNLTVIFFRMLFASIILAILILFLDKSLFLIHLRDLGLFAVSGLFGLTLMNALYNVAITEGSLALAAVLLALSPLFVLLSAVIFLHERLTGQKIVCVLLALAGCILVSGILEGGGAASSAKGVLCGVLSAVSYACYGIFSKKIASKNYHFLTVTLYTSLFSSLFLLPFSDLSSAVKIMADRSSDAFLVLILHAILTSVVPYALYSLSMEYLDAGKVAILVSIEPASAMVIGILCYGETPTFLSVAGLCCNIAAIALLNLPEKHAQ